MTEKNIIYCDRCGKDLSIEEWNEWQKWIRYKEINHFSIFSQEGKKTYDFCNKCMKEHCEWVNKK